MVTHIDNELSSLTRLGPLFQPLQEEMKHTKDPCPVYDGKRWHIFGTGYHDQSDVWYLVHIVADELYGPWKELPPINLGHVSGHCVAAPGIEYDSNENQFHMFIQTTCFGLGGEIMHLVSEAGNQFLWKDVSLQSISNTPEAGIYDSHPAIINGQKYLVYSGMSVVGRPDIYLARSRTNSWSGPWDRLGCILQHEEVNHHNQIDHHDYEWGLEGAQLYELPDGSIILNAVCFLPEGDRGTRQRIFLATAPSVQGSFSSLGPVLRPTEDGWESGENGHGSIIIQNDMLHLFYQAKQKSVEDHWRFGLATISVKEFISWKNKRLQTNINGKKEE